MKDVFGGRNIQYIQPNQSFPHHWYVSSLRHIWVSKRTCHARARSMCVHARRIFCMILSIQGKMLKIGVYQLDDKDNCG